MRRKIILKATELFLSLGFKSVTMDDLAQSMAISKKTIYQYFQNKDQLISSCVESVQNKIVKDLHLFDSEGKRYNFSSLRDAVNSI